MSIANDLNDVIEASGDMLARLAIFADQMGTTAISLIESNESERRSSPHC